MIAVLTVFGGNSLEETIVFLQKYLFNTILAYFGMRKMPSKSIPDPKLYEYNSQIAVSGTDCAKIIKCNFTYDYWNNNWIVIVL